jgi:hypothetical protein
MPEFPGAQSAAQTNRNRRREREIRGTPAHLGRWGRSRRDGKRQNPIGRPSANRRPAPSDVVLIYTPVLDLQETWRGPTLALAPPAPESAGLRRSRGRWLG